MAIFFSAWTALFGLVGGGASRSFAESLGGLADFRDGGGTVLLFLLPLAWRCCRDVLIVSIITMSCQNRLCCLDCLCSVKLAFMQHLLSLTSIQTQQFHLIFSTRLGLAPRLLGSGVERWLIRPWQCTLLFPSRSGCRSGRRSRLSRDRFWRRSKRR